MSLPREKKRSLDLEKDWAITREDFEAIGRLGPQESRDLGSYLDFLDELWGLEKKEIGKRFYPDPFHL